LVSEKDTIATSIDKLFWRLDPAKLNGLSVITSDAQKEHSESLIMFAFRKLQAARYHGERVSELLELQQKYFGKLLATRDFSDLPPETVKATHKVSKSANEFAFELSACLAAIRSGIDFLAKVCAIHSKGVFCEG
jgi:hypothetical protein